MLRTTTRWGFSLGTILILSLVILSCSTVPLTGRTQISLIPAATMLSMSAQQYSDFLNSNPVVTGTAESQMVKRVGLHIRDAVEEYFEDQNLESELKGYTWEFNLIDTDQVNAWAMPGGKIVFYSGILPYTQNEEGLAVVMGHEIAHVVAKHGNERMSQQLIVQMGGLALSKALESKPEETQALALTAFGVGSQVFGILPYSRMHEYEADRLGTIFMALAGYDPAAAPAFWSRMSQSHGGGAPPEFLSTHPSDQNRIAKLQEVQAEARQYYRPRD